MQKNWKTILYLLDEAQFVDVDTPPKLDLRMEALAKKKPDHPAVKAYQRYRGGPDETIRSVIMTVNARIRSSSQMFRRDTFGTVCRQKVSRCNTRDYSGSPHLEPDT